MSDSKVFLDSNVCLYLLSEDSLKKNKAESLLALPNTVISSQVISETINVGIKKFKLQQQELLDHINFLQLNCEIVTISAALQTKAMDLHFRYQYSFYDSQIVAAALQSGCVILYSEDLQQDQVIENKLTIINPFV